MKPLDVLIIDDEPLARDVLEGYINQIPGLQLAGKCKDAFEAQQMLMSRQVDLLLVDINMPRINGIDFLKSLRQLPYIIFTTAYAEYAVQSYELNAVDYLLKPIAFERFFTAIGKVMNLARNAKQADISESPAGRSEENVMFIKANGKLVKIDLNKLWLVEGLKDYMKLYVDSESFVVYNTMKNIESQLMALPQFIRINKSNIVNLKYISEIEGNAIKIKDKQFVIGPTYKDKVSMILDRYKMM
ncbi:MAG: hypothetical protein BGO70_02365 [Bacteroidetes bacterium 43-93]|nr:response regulator transcription factor [Bacteroidota bacterium]OJW99141.1 MAG: hypothetical protein BGO70_02365 [Bacteroidetes bacterium 43-93]